MWMNQVNVFIGTLHHIYCEMNKHLDWRFSSSYMQLNYTVSSKYFKNLTRIRPGSWILCNGFTEFHKYRIYPSMLNAYD